MKRFLYILTLIFITSAGVFAQEDLVMKAAKSAQSGNYEEAQLSIDQAVLEDANASSPKAWYYYGFIYKELYKAKEMDNPGSPYRMLALKGLKKSVDIEAAGTYAEDCKKMIKYMTNTMYNDAVKALNSQDFKNAFMNYKGYMDAMKVVDPAGIEDKVIFHTGYTAYMNSDLETALKYFNEVKEKDYGDPLLYFFLGKIYHDTGDKDKSIEVLSEGKVKHPLAKDINDLYINYMLEQGKLTALEDEFKKAIGLSPDDLELYVTLALLYESKAELDPSNNEMYLNKAVEIYKQIIEKDGNHVRANYNLALLFYNKAVNMMNSMDDDDDDIFALNDIQDQCIELFRKSLPYFNKAHELQPNNKEVLIGLGGVHFSLNNMDKSEEFKAKLKKLEESEGSN